MASTQSDKSDESDNADEDDRDEETTSSEEADQADERAEAEQADGTDEGADSGDSDDESGESDDGDDDDQASGEEASSDGSGAERAAGGAAGAPQTSKAKKEARPNKKDGLTAGARLAAAKAAKAARKAAKRGKEKKELDPVAAVRDSELAKKAQEATSWAAQNRNVVIAIAAVLVLGIAGWVAWSSYRDGEAEAAGTLLADAVEIAQAEIVAEEEPDAAGDAAGDDAPAAADAEPDPDAPRTFPTEEARAEASLEAYRRVLTQYPSSDAAVWARLGEARALQDLGRNEEARAAYETAEREGGSDPSVALRALEGRAFTFEAEEQWDQALQVYERLSTVDDNRYRPVAEYHRARMYIAKGERERATETLRELVEGLGQAEEDDAAQDFSYVLAQAETRLRELDPSAAPPPRPSESPLGGLGGGPSGQMSNEQLQELIRQFQQKQLQEQQGGGAE